MPDGQDRRVEAFKHAGASRKNIPTAEYQAVVDETITQPIEVVIQRRNRDLDPQLVWRGKDDTLWSDLVVHAPPLYIQEKIHPKALIDDLMRRSREGEFDSAQQLDLFADFNGLPDDVARTEFYKHDANWTNRMILGDSLYVMASLLEREGLRGQVQMIYMDPPYGIKFNSNFQWSTTTRNVRDGEPTHITREPEQVKAFRDTWRDGINSYLTYLRDRLLVARELLAESGSIFVQIGDENLSRIVELLREVFGDDNVLLIIPFQKKAYQDALSLAPVNDYLVWAAKSRRALKFRPLFVPTPFEGDVGKYNRIESPDLVVESSTDKTKEELEALIAAGWRLVREDYPVVSQDPPREPQPFFFQGVVYEPPKGRHWSVKWPEGMLRLARAGRLRGTGRRLYARQYWTDSPVVPLNNLWTQLKGPANPTYVVETSPEVVKRCILMTTDPGDLVLDPTCGSGTTAYVAEQWGRRWIVIDTSRVALALARARLMGARYPYYLLADSPEGLRKEAEISRTDVARRPTAGDIRQGFVYERVPRITLQSIADNAEIDIIWEKYQEHLEPLRQRLNTVLGEKWEEWEVPRHAEADWPEEARRLHAQYWELRISRQKEIDASIAARAEFQYLYDRPYEDSRIVRVTGPFTVESISPHRSLIVGENDELIDPLKGRVATNSGAIQGFAEMVLESLKAAGVQQMAKHDRIVFTSVTPWPGEYVHAEGRYIEGGGDGGASKERRAAIFIGPEFGTASRADLVAAAREAADAGFDVLIACAFNFEAHASEFSRLGRIPVLKARMNPELYMAADLKSTGAGNLFVVFGEPDIELLETEDGRLQVKINGVDVFDPQTGQVRSDGPEGIACWFIDTDYNEESFFVRHAYFLGAPDPYEALKRTLRAEINEQAWETLYSDISYPFPKPRSGRIAVKVINQFGDEVMKVFRVG